VKVYWGMEVKHCYFLFLAMDAGQLSFSGLERIIAGERNPIPLNRRPGRFG
jgi:hypothetical protein